MVVLMTHFLALVLTVGASIWTVSSYFEMSAFNRVSDTDVTLWEAMFVELRIEAEVID